MRRLAVVLLRALPCGGDRAVRLGDGRIDFLHAFHQFPIDPAEAKFMGIRIGGRIYLPRRALYGTKLWPAYISAIGATIAQGLKANGVDVIFMIDDFLVTGQPGPKDCRGICAWKLAQLIAALRSIGFELNDDKTEGPTASRPHLQAIYRDARYSMPSTWSSD